MAAVSTNKKEWILQKESEIRCEVPENSTLILKLVSGTAELFGVELALNKEYYFRDQNIAVFTWYGCKLESSGDDTALYQYDTTPMVSYVNTHIQLEARRDVALANGDFGPRVMLVGPPDHGKSSLTQILTAYAVRLDRSPILVDLDVGQGALGISGCLAAAPVDKTNLSVEEGFGSVTPLVYYFGYNSPRENVELYKLLTTIIADRVKRRLEKDLDAKASGVIINTCGWVDGAGYDAILHCAKAFEVDVLLVMGQDKLYSTLHSALSTGGKVIVVKLPRSGGVVTRDSASRKRLRKSRIREYFYGRTVSPTAIAYSPERREGVPISSYIFLKVGGIQLTQGMRIIGDSSHQDTCKLTRVVPSSDLAYNILGVLNPLEDENIAVQLESDTGTGNAIGEFSQNLLNANIAGFISVVQIDIENDKMTLLCPCPGALPSNVLLVGGIKWVE